MRNDREELVKSLTREKLKNGVCGAGYLLVELNESF
jgi:hypothetical protein